MANPSPGSNTSGTPTRPRSGSGVVAAFGEQGLRQFGGYVREEFLRDLMGPRGVQVYREMRDNDSTVGALLFAITMLLRSAQWRVLPADNTSPEDQEAADYIEECFGDMGMPLSDIVAEALSFLTFGWAFHEILYKYRRGPTGRPATDSNYDDGRLGWRSFPLRAQETLLHWVFDEDGGVEAMVQITPQGTRCTIPMRKALLFRTTTLKNNPDCLLYTSPSPRD